MINYKKDALLSLVGFVLPVVVGLYAIPSLLSSLGGERFGVLTLVWAIVGLSSIFDIGVGRSLTYLISVNSKNEFEIRSIYTTGLLMVLVVSSLCAAVICLSSEKLSVLMNAKIIQINELHNAIAYCSIGVVPTAINSVIRGAAEGLSDYYLSMLNRIAVGSGMFAVPLVSDYFWGPNLAFITLAIVGFRWLCMLHMLYSVKLSFGKICQSNLKKICMYGSWITVSNVVSPIMVYADRFFISNLLGAGDVQFYAIPQEAMQKLLLIPSAISNSVVSKLTMIGKTNEWIFASKKFLQHGKVIHLSSLLMFLVCSKALFVLWLGEDFWLTAEPIVYLVLVGIYFNGIAQYYTVFLSSKNKTKQMAIIHCLEFPFYMAAMYLSIKYYGLMGAATAWSSRVVIDCWMLKTIYNKIS